MNISITGQYSKTQGFQFSEPHYFDFIQTDQKNFYYIEDSRSLVKQQNLSNIYINTIKKYRNMWDNISNQERAEIGKIPYLYQSLLQEKNLRFPIIFNNTELLCGFGRAMIATRYFPDIKLPGIIISKSELPYLKLKSINDVMNIIIEFEYWKDKDLSNINFGFVIDENNLIHATDYQNKNEQFVYKFIEDSGTKDDHWNKTMSIINSYSSINNQTILEIIDQLIKI